MKNILQIILLSTVMLVASNIHAAITISLDANKPALIAPDNVVVDINRSALQSAGTDVLLGAWEMDFIYDPIVFDFLPIPPAGFGTSLGDVFLGEAISLAQPVTTPGIFHVGVLSLLEADAATCIFCLPPFLEDLQSDSFTLATVGLSLPAGSKFLGTSAFSMNNVVLSDALGNEIFADSLVDGSVQVVPVPGALILMISGLIGIGAVGRRKRTD